MSKIIHKKSSVATKVPLTTDLEYGELALNYTDGKLYYLNSNNTIQSIAGSSTGAAVGSSNTFTANQIVEVTDNTNAALRITQLGTGNALLVEDSTNPDVTPFVINQNGGVVSGHTALDSNWYSPSNTPQIIQVASTANGNRQGFASISYTGAPGFSMFRANGGVLGTESAVISGDSTGILTFAGYDGTTSGAIPTAFIQSQVDSTPGVGSMPGRLTFSTTASGAIVPTERIRIASTGAIGLSGANYGSSGQVLTSAGSGATPTWSTVSSGGGGGINYTTKTANYTAVVDEGILANTSAGAFTITLPSTAATGSQVVIVDDGNSWATNNLTIARNGSTISGLSEDLICDINGVSIQLIYDGSTWKVFTQVGASNTGVVTLSDAQTLTNKVLDAGTVITSSGSATALRITQTGTGDALRVEDSANPDSTSFIINNSGAIGLAGANYGTTGQVLSSQGSGTSPVWSDRTSASANGVIYENGVTISENYALSSNKNGFSVGPITINSGISVNVPSGQRWVVI